MLIVWVGEVRGQTPRVYANSQRSGTTNNVVAFITVADGSVTNPSNAADADLSNSTRLTAWSTLGAGTAWSQLIFPTSVPANNIVYVKTKIITSSLLGNELTMSGYNGSIAGAGGNDGSSITTTNSPTLTLSDGFTYLVARPSSIFNSIRTTLSSPVALGTNTVDLYSAFYLPTPTVTGTPSGAICSGTQINIGISSPNPLLQYNWYASDGTFISTGNTFSPSPTSTTATTIIYYTEAQEIGTSFYSARVPVSVTVNPVSILSSTLTPSAICSNNNFNYVPTSATSGTTFTWTRAAVSGINNPTNSGSASVNEILINTTASPISVTYVYTSALNTCNTTQNVTVTVNPLPNLTTIPLKTLCIGEAIDLQSLNPTSNVTGGTYVWSENQGGTPLTNTTVIPSIGSNEYWVRYSSNGCYSDQKATILANPLPEFTITASTSVVPIGTNNVTLTSTPVAATINWYNQDGTSLGSGPTKNVGPFATAGTYTFNAIADNGPGTCSTSESITITVYDPNACPPLTERVYADSQTWSSIVTGGVFNPDQAVNGDVKTSSTLNTGLGLLGLGTVWQNLLWSQPVAAGTPVTIKLGPATSALALASGISVIAFKKNSAGTMIDIGTMQSVDGSLLSLLSGENAFEFTFVPSDATGVKEYDGVRVQLGAVLSLVQSVNLFHAYHSRPATSSLDCSKGDVLDILYGAVPLVAGIGALSATVNVSNPWNAVDKNESTFATLSSGVAVLAYAKEQIIFSSPSLPSDSLKIITSRPSGLLTLDLLTGFSIQRYLGTSPVGSPITSSSTFLNIKLLDGGTQAAILLLPTGEPYDRVEIRLGGAVNLLSSINVHEVQRIANTKLPAATDNDNNITVCKGDDITLPTPPNSCTSFKWYDALTGGNEIPGSTINTSSFDGPKKFYIQPIRYGCELMPRGVLNVTIKQPAISLGSPPTVCQGLSSVTLPYSALSCATKYNISWDPNATAVGFLPVSNGVFSNGIIPIPVPTGPLAIPGTYTGFLNISNGPSVSVTYSFTITILPKPPTPHVAITTNSQY